jgi:TatA/E family protein of Tat protein translocase
MDFLGIGPWELILILIIAFIIFGPGRLPEIARAMGKGIHQLKRASTDFSVAVSREMDEMEPGERNKAREGEKSREDESARS